MKKIAAYCRVSHRSQKHDKANAIRSLIDRIVCHWGEEPTTDRRHKDGIRTFCQAVTIHSTAAIKDEQGETAPIMTIETSCRCCW